jgi:hypothetical protein
MIIADDRHISLGFQGTYARDYSLHFALVDQMSS